MVCQVSQCLVVVLHEEKLEALCLGWLAMSD